MIIFALSVPGVLGLQLRVHVLLAEELSWISSTYVVYLTIAIMLPSGDLTSQPLDHLQSQICAHAHRYT